MIIQLIGSYGLGERWNKSLWEWSSKYGLVIVTTGFASKKNRIEKVCFEDEE